MNADISKIIKDREMGSTQRMMKKWDLRFRFGSLVRSASLFPQTTHNCGSYSFDALYARHNILTKMYWLSIPID